MAPDPSGRGYPVPARDLHRVEDIVRRSRFVTSVGPAPDPDAARGFIDAVRSEFDDATHHCWGFVAGPPGTTAHVGLSDAGEPHGTAGRPILNALLHSGVGEVVAVVTRYFGGVKLGKGGLGRAYSDAVVHAMESLPTVRRIDRACARILVPFRCSDGLFRLLDEMDGRDRDETYTDRLQVRIRIPDHQVDRLRGEIAALTSGEGEVRVVSTEGEEEG